MHENRTQQTPPAPARCLVTFSAFALTACATWQPYERPDVSLPADWSTSGTAQETALVDDWRTVIADERLRTLVKLALEHSHDMEAASAQVRQLQAQFRIREAARLPAVMGVASGNRQTNSRSESIASQYAVGLTIADWELDFFGRLQSLQDASLAQFLSFREAQRALAWSLVAGVAHAWLEVQTAEAQLGLTRRVLDNREQFLQLIETRRRHGTASDIEVWQARALQEQARAALADQQRQRDAARIQLSALVGMPLDQRLDEDLLVAPASRVMALRDVQPSLPSDILLQRPDVRAAEWQLAAAHAHIGAARAAFFPRISLTAGLGSASAELGGLLRSGAWGWSLAPQAVLPIFNARANQSQLEASEAARDAALAQYRKAIHTAFSEVQEALSTREALRQQWQAQTDLLLAESERLQRVRLQFERGVTSRLEWLDAERSTFAAEQALLLVHSAIEHNRVVLLRVLGG